MTTDRANSVFCVSHIPVRWQNELRQLIARGWHDRRIAAHTGLSFGTVRRYVMLTMRECGARTRAELVALNPDGEEATLP